MESESLEDLRFRPLRAGYLLSCVAVCVVVVVEEGASMGVGRLILVPGADDCVCCDCMVLLLRLSGVWNRGLVSLIPSRPKTTSSRPVVVAGLVFKPGLIMGMADRSGLSSSSDLKRKSDSGDCSILSQADQSSPEPELEKANPPKMGDTGEPDPGDGAESVVSSAALQSSMEL